MRPFPAFYYLTNTLYVTSSSRAYYAATSILRYIIFLNNKIPTSVHAIT